MDTSKLKSLANTADYPAGVGVAVNKEMNVWRKLEKEVEG